MMDHQAVQDQLFALYDGELTGASRQAVEKHLSGCVECRAVMAQWKQVAGACFQSPAVSPSEPFVGRVMQRIAAPPKSPGVAAWKQKARWLIPSLGVATALLLMAAPARRPVSVEALLLGSEPPSADAVLEVILEGQP